MDDLKEKIKKLLKEMDYEIDDTGKILSPKDAAFDFRTFRDFVYIADILENEFKIVIDNSFLSEFKGAFRSDLEIIVAIIEKLTLKEGVSLPLFSKTE